jgi:hypothetical protein
MHSTSSDGRLSPTAVVQLAAERGLDLIALTDHDTLRGVAEAQAAGREHGVAVLPGIELSGRYPDGQCHLLAWLPDPVPVAFLDWTHVKERDREARAREMVERTPGFVLDRGQGVRGFAGGGGGFVDLHAGEGEGAFGAGVRVAAVADDAGDDLAVASDDKLRGNARDAVEAGRGAFIEGVGTALVGVEDEAHIGILRLVDGNPFFKGGDRVARAGGENYHVLILVFRC